MDFYMHDQCGCRHAPEVGARLRRMSRNILTGQESGFRTYTVVAVEPLRHDRLFCRRATLRGEDGREWHPFVQDLAAYQRIENIVAFRPDDRSVTG